MRKTNRLFGVGAGYFLMLLAAVIPASAQSYREIYNFTGNPGGEAPPAGLINDSAGNLYGATWLGGSRQLGTVNFQVLP
jgi:hypothetical protein